MKKYNYTYIITNNLNGKQYIGDHSTDNLNDGYMGSGILLKEDQKLMGKEIFTKEILEFFDTKEEAYNAQSKYIKIYKTHILQGGYNKNLTGGQWASKHSNLSKKKIGEGVLKAYRENPEIKEKISEKSKLLSGERNGMYGKTQDINKMKQRWIDNPHPWIGRSHTEETKKKISIVKKGKKHSIQTIEKMKISNSGENNGMYGRKHSKEAKEKQRKTALSRKKKTCYYCGKVISHGMYKRWHGINCKKNNIQ
jgi:hypothetical protein